MSVFLEIGDHKPSEDKAVCLFTLQPSTLFPVPGVQRSSVTELIHDVPMIPRPPLWVEGFLPLASAQRSVENHLDAGILTDQSGVRRGHRGG